MYIEACYIKLNIFLLRKENFSVGGERLGVNIYV